MKLCLLVGMVHGAAARLQVAGHHHMPGEHVALIASQRGGVHYGDTECPCIGFDNIEGDTIMQVEVEDGATVEMAYPADVGAHCETWDNERHPQCKQGETPGAGNGWCGQPWCWVDPCRCNIDVLPKMSQWTPGVSYRSKPLFWSYATCGGKDMFTKSVEGKSRVPWLGLNKCRCIGFAGVAGTTEITLDGEMVEYPADMGSTCQAWDMSKHPECRGDKVPSWCRSSWCYVDPCECQLPGDTVPKISAYLPTSTFTGKNLYYSYETCGSPDTWTETGNPNACVNQETEEACGEQQRCGWSGTRCLGWELLDHPLCKANAITKKHSGHERSGAAAHASHVMVGAALLAAALAAPA